MSIPKEDKKPMSEWYNRWYNRDGSGVYRGKPDKK